MPCCFLPCCCNTTSNCGLRYVRLFYILFQLIAYITVVAVQGSPDIFDSKFWKVFPAYKNLGLYDPVWAFTIRFTFTFFIFHAVLLFFSLFQLAKSTVGFAKFFHRGFLPFKFILLVCLFFIFFCISNKDMHNFYYLSAALSGVFCFFELMIFAEFFFVFYAWLQTQNAALRYFGIALIFINYGVAIFCYVWVLMKDSSQTIVIATSVLIVLNALLFVISVLPKSNSSSFVSSFVSVVSAIYFLRITAGNQVYLGGYSKPILDVAGVHCCDAFLLIFAVTSMVMMNVTEVATRTMFLGTNAPPEFGSMQSTVEDEESRSNESSYYYWAFHLLMIGASCYLSGFAAFSQPAELSYVTYAFGVGGCGLFLLYFSWTSFFPMVAKDRIFN